MELTEENLDKLEHVVSTEPDPYWISRELCLELIEFSRELIEARKRSEHINILNLVAEARHLVKKYNSFLEIKFGDNDGELSLLIQKSEGESPAFAAARLKRELSELKKKYDVACEERDSFRSLYLGLEGV